LLKFQHHAHKFVAGAVFSLELLADLVILAIDALHIAAGEKNSATAFRAAYHRFLPIVELMAVDPHLRVSKAKPSGCKPVDPAVARANFAIGQIHQWFPIIINSSLRKYFLFNSLNESPFVSNPARHPSAIQFQTRAVQNPMLHEGHNILEDFF